jgi:hypothetical protein
MRARTLMTARRPLFDLAARVRTYAVTESSSLARRPRVRREAGGCEIKAPCQEEKAMARPPLGRRE